MKDKGKGKNFFKGTLNIFSDLGGSLEIELKILPIGNALFPLPVRCSGRFPVPQMISR